MAAQLGLANEIVERLRTKPGVVADHAGAFDAVGDEVFVDGAGVEQLIAGHQNANTLSAWRIWAAVSPSSGTSLSAWAISSSL